MGAGGCFEVVFGTVLKRMLSDVEDVVGTPHETVEKMGLVSLCVLYLLHSRVFGYEDKKMFKAVYMLYKKVPVVCLYGNVLFGFNEFLISHFPNMVKVLSKKVVDLSGFRAQFLDTLLGTLPDTLRELTITINTWKMRLATPLTDMSVKAAQYTCGSSCSGTCIWVHGEQLTEEPSFNASLLFNPNLEIYRFACRKNHRPQQICGTRVCHALLYHGYLPVHPCAAH